MDLDRGSAPVRRQPRGSGRGFEVLPKRWIVERTFSWLIRNRRLSKDYERSVQTSETFIEVASIRLMLRRLARER
jgi:putative transposase